MRTKYKNARVASCSFVIFSDRFVKLCESKSSLDAFYGNFALLNTCSNMLTNRQGSVWLNRENDLKRRNTNYYKDLNPLNSSKSPTTGHQRCCLRVMLSLGTRDLWDTVCLGGN